MEYLIFFVLILFSTYVLSAQTYHFGTINSDEVWHSADNPHIITGYITVGVGYTLTIEAGDTIKFNGNYEFIIHGRLTANGTQSEHIVFTSNETVPYQGDWKGLHFDSYDSASSLAYCDISYAINNITLDNSSDTFIITDIISSHATSSGYKDNSSNGCQISNSIFMENGTGIDITSQNSYTCLENCEITSNNYDINIDCGTGNQSSIVHLESCTVTSNTYGIYCWWQTYATYSDWNNIYDNTTYNLVNGTINVGAENIYWGYTDEASIETKIKHYLDDQSLGLVDFTPWANTPQGFLDIPQNVTITTVSDSVHISWNAVTGANSYKIFASDTPNGTFSDISSQRTFNGESWCALISESKKFYYVKAVN